MNWLETFRTGWDAVRSHRLRSALTMLGILIGIAAVILTVGLGQGAQQKVSAQISALGSNLLIVSPGSTTSTTGVRGGFGSASTLTVADAAALARPGRGAGHRGRRPGQDHAPRAWSTGSTNWTTSVVGTTPDWLAVRARTVTEGRFLTDGGPGRVGGRSPCSARRPRRSCSAQRDAVGQTVTINGIPFSVIGVLNSAGSDSTSNLDDQAMVPMIDRGRAARRRDHAQAVSTIYLQAPIELTCCRRRTRRPTASC